MSAPKRLVLMRIATDEDARFVGEVHSSFDAIPGVRCTVAASRAVMNEQGAEFTHVSMFEFDDAAARTNYHDHPRHRAARDDVRSHATGFVIVDLN